MRPASNSFLGSFLSPVPLCLPSPARGASRTLVSSCEPPFRKGFCLGAAAEEAEATGVESAMAADGKLGLVFWDHQSLSLLGPAACTTQQKTLGIWLFLKFCRLHLDDIAIENQRACHCKPVMSSECAIRALDCQLQHEKMAQVFCDVPKRVNSEDVTFQDDAYKSVTLLASAGAEKQMKAELSVPEGYV